MTALTDLVVVVPGIMGSVLEVEGSEIWATSTSALLRIGTSFGRSFRRLALTEDTPEDIDLRDGVKATRLIRFPHMLSGLTKCDGYSRLIDKIEGYFDVSPFGQRCLLEFAYDWRRDNRASARKLKNTIDGKLKSWRKEVPTARVIILAHSMGGLVARYYLEVLQGWEDCRALVSFGTPYRGSVDALNYLSNGYNWLKGLFDFTEVMHTFTSVYQLLPSYKVLDYCGEYHKVCSIPGVPRIEQRRAEAAHEFYEEIRKAEELNKTNARYHTDGYKVFPYIGIQQPTFQSATLSNGGLVLSRTHPKLDSRFSGGDGTVPKFSAILNDDMRGTFLAERHACLQSNSVILLDLLTRIEWMLDPQHPPDLLGPFFAQNQPGLTLDLEDTYLEDQTIYIRVSSSGTLLTAPPHAYLEAENSQGEEFQFVETSDGWLLKLDGLEPGLYRIRVTPSREENPIPSTVSDIFEVLNCTTTC